MELFGGKKIRLQTKITVLVCTVVHVSNHDQMAEIKTKILQFMKSFNKYK